MRHERVNRFVIRALAIVGVLVVAWLLPPVMHRALHLCPVRPDSIATAGALPSFSRKYGVSCSQCHYGYPVLNALGRQFKANGYVMGRGDEEGVLKSQDGQLWIEKLFPWGVIVRSRPFDNGRGNISNQGTWVGGTAKPNPNGFKTQPLNDIDFFVAGGDAAKQVSWEGELDANANSATSFQPALGDIRLGYHPSPYYNLIATRKGFFDDDPYQTISGMESPTIAARSVDLMMSDQGSISGRMIAGSQQTLYLTGLAALPNSAASLYYAVGAAKDTDLGKQYNAPTNGIIRLAFDDTAKIGLMVGTFGSYGHERNDMAAGGMGGGLGIGALTNPGVKDQFVRGGFDALWEFGDIVARSAFAYLHDGDPSLRGASATDRAAYAELAYYYKRAGNAAPFLVPLVRENWYTTFNGKQQFNYVTFQLAHYFASSVKAFVEYSADTKQGYQGGTLFAPQTAPGRLATRGNRVTGQIEVGF